MDVENWKISTVALIASDLCFVSDSQDVQAIKDDYPKDHPVHNYDAFFTSPITGAPVWAMVGIVPYVSKLVTSVESMNL